MRGLDPLSAYDATCWMYGGKSMTRYLCQVKLRKMRKVSGGRWDNWDNAVNTQNGWSHLNSCRMMQLLDVNSCNSVELRFAWTWLASRRAHREGIFTCHRFIFAAFVPEGSSFNHFAAGRCQTLAVAPPLQAAPRLQCARQDMARAKHGTSSCWLCWLMAAGSGESGSGSCILWWKSA